jgi:hypothetical protein
MSLSDELQRSYGEFPYFAIAIWRGGKDVLVKYQVYLDYESKKDIENGWLGDKPGKLEVLTSPIQNNDRAFEIDDCLARSFAGYKTTKDGWFKFPKGTRKPQKIYRDAIDYESDLLWL